MRFALFIFMTISTLYAWELNSCSADSDCGAFTDRHGDAVEMACGKFGEGTLKGNVCAPKSECGNDVMFGGERGLFNCNAGGSFAWVWILLFLLAGAAGFYYYRKKVKGIIKNKNIDTHSYLM